jgi:hypothetical protein
MRSHKELYAEARKKEVVDAYYAKSLDFNLRCDTAIFAKKSLTNENLVYSYDRLAILWYTKHPLSDVFCFDYEFRLNDWVKSWQAGLWQANNPELIQNIVSQVIHEMGYQIFHCEMDPNGGYKAKITRL